jgi:formylglycine-generating enzyme required for sulfatase activity
MKFVPVPGTKVLFSIWETRVQDYAAYAVAVSGVDGTWKDYEYEGHKQGPDHPVVNVSWEDAQAFCKWLSKKEGKTYRLPTDHEWSVAVGIGDRESADVSPSDKDGRIEGYPWGNQWPPPKESGNFGSIYRRTDPHVFTAPVGSYQVTRLGLYDLSGNAREWCDAFYQSGKEWRVLRGGCWVDCDPTVAEMEEDRRRVLDGGRMKFSALAKLRSSYRFYDAPASRKGDSGFRCVLEVGSGG